MDWKKLLAYITGSVDQELLLRNEYLVTENRILRQQIQGRLKLTDAERKSLAELAKKLGKKTLEEVAHLVKPDTLLGWPADREEVRRLQESAISRATTSRRRGRCPGRAVCKRKPELGL